MIKMPNTREKLIELLFDCVSENLIPEQKSSNRLTIEIHHGNIADHLIANGVVVQKWISVSERLPENKGNYLGFTGSTTMVGYYKGDGVWWIWLNDREGENLFTHWMPLPEPPKGE